MTLALALLFSREARSDDNLQFEGYGLEGSWINTVSPHPAPGAPPVTFRTYVTVAGSGAWIGSDRTRPFAGPQHGTWVHVQGHEYAWTFAHDLFDPAGAYLGTFKGRSRVQLVGKNEHVGVANVEQRDPSGKVVPNRCARQRRVRVVVERFAPLCEGLEPGMWKHHESRGGGGYAPISRRAGHPSATAQNLLQKPRYFPKKSVL